MESLGFAIACFLNILVILRMLLYNKNEHFWSNRIIKTVHDFWINHYISCSLHSLKTISQKLYLVPDPQEEKNYWKKWDWILIFILWILMKVIRFDST